jgi:dTDP-glucose 4,6-dehydratase
LQDKPLTIHGTGNYTRDWTYVEDTCEALDRAMQVPLETVKGQVINIGTGEDIAIKRIANIILKKLDKPKSLLTYMEERPGQVDRHVASAFKAKKLLGWESQTDFEHGLEQTIEWYKNNPEWWHKIEWMSRVPTKKQNGTVEYY